MNNLLHRLGRTTALIVATGFVAHAAGDGNLAVQVLDVTGKPIAGATVVISSPGQIGGARTQVTDASGKVRFVRLNPSAFKVVVTASGFQTQTLNGVNVLIDQTANVNLKMVPVGGAVVEVVSSLPIVDVTSVTAGTQITQEELTTLPLLRDQLSTLSLAPGVVAIGNNPALAAGNNRDNFGQNGARNNTYMVDGIDVTSPESGLYRTTIPQELVQNQDIKTGAITAEYSARAGLFSNVTTIPGGNELTGGLIYSMTDPSWSSAPSQFTIQAPGHKIDDTTAFVSGPILKDKLWFVASYQKVKETVDVTLLDSVASTPNESRTGLFNDESRTFAKLTWQIAEGHLASATFNKNPGHFDNGTTVNTPTRRLTNTTRGGDRYTLSYSWQTPSFIFDVKTISHKEADSIKANYTNLGPQVDVIFPTASGSPSVAQSAFGNSSAGTGREYKRQSTRVDGTFLFDAAGSHTLKTGVQMGTDQLTQTLFISGGVQYENFNAPTTYGNDIANYGGQVKGARSKVLASINNNPTYATLKAALDTNVDGTVDAAERDVVNFNTPYDAGNLALGYLGYRFINDSLASSSPKMETQGAYIQDQWQIGRLTFSPGFRMDKYEYKADNGQSLFKTDWAFAPRVGASYDVDGDGRTKAYAYWGRYIDPIKLDMVRFTGSLSSSVRNEDIYIQPNATPGSGTWVTENVRGGSKVVDAVFANSFKLPKTEEFRIGLAKDFGNSWSIDAVYTYRRDYDIVEDWDPSLYTSADALEDEARSLWGIGSRAAVPYNTLTGNNKAIVDKFRSLVIDPEYFAGGGYTGAQNVARLGTSLNFVLANLPGGHRQYNTFDVTVTRKFKDNWGGFYTYSNVRATGNTQSSGNADYQGDLAQYDPRLAYGNGRLDGSIDWLHKANVYYRWNNGFQLGVTGTFISGYHYSDAEQIGTRILQKAPALADAFSEQAGKNRTPSTKLFDARIQYSRKFGVVKGEVSLNIFNVFNRQTEQDIVEGNGLTGANLIGSRRGISGGNAFTWTQPRNFAMGFKVTF
ncbi:MAG TPA: carboxypeptidase regulatory-like domain-containing protein [Holophagaceae bacterium]|nr:carboxypeptidase regulatory-like domain-containing protein [Holophagaceae bacterium]